MTLRDLIELVGLALLVVAVAVATWTMIWPAILAAAAVAVYLSHAWVWGGDGVDDPRIAAAERIVQAVERNSRRELTAAVAGWHELEPVSVDAE